MEKAGLRAGLLFVPAISHTRVATTPQQTVDGLHGALEIGARSSYVPNSPIGVRSAGPAVRA
jgi:hypothetical protein